MSLVPCPECGNEISDKAVMCLMCGYSKRGTGGFYCYEYKSKRTLFGLPLVHIVMGPAFDPANGNLRIAKGIIPSTVARWVFTLLAGRRLALMPWVDNCKLCF